MRPAEVVQMLDYNPLPEPRKFVSTGSLGLDLAIGGWPVGRVSEIYGPPFCGKTTLALAGVREMQKLGTVAYIDLDGDFNPDYARRIGIDLKRLLVVSRPWRDHRANVLELPQLIAPVDFAIVDPLAHYGDAAMLSHLLPRQTLLLVSQVRAALNDRYRHTTGGYAPYAATKIRLRPDVNRGAIAEVRECPFTPAYRQSVIYLNQDGLDRAGEVFDLALQAGFIATQAGHYYVAGNHIGHGRTEALRAVQSREGALPALERALRTGTYPYDFDSYFSS